MAVGQSFGPTTEFLSVVHRTSATDCFHPGSAAAGRRGGAGGGRGGREKKWEVRRVKGNTTVKSSFLYGLLKCCPHCPCWGGAGVGAGAGGPGPGPGHLAVLCSCSMLSAGDK